MGVKDLSLCLFCFEDGRYWESGEKTEAISMSDRRSWIQGEHMGEDARRVSCLKMTFSFDGFYFLRKLR